MFGELPAIDGRPGRRASRRSTSCLVASMKSAASFKELLQQEAAGDAGRTAPACSDDPRLSTRVYEFSAAIMAITGRKLYGEMQNIRAIDVYPDEEVKALLVEKTFPKSAEDMTLKLSNVTAAFYGLMLANVGERFGWKEADAISKAVSGARSTENQGSMELGVDLPKDPRAPVLVFITAVHSASPEYNFEVFEYLPEDATVRVFGISRYDRIAKALDIERHLTWPELLSFFEGAAEELGIQCKVQGELKELGEQGRYECIYRVTQ